MLEGRSTLAQRAEIEAHLETCNRCRSRAADVQTLGLLHHPTSSAQPSTNAEPDAPGLVLARGTLLGRYMLLEALGAGGMGSVYLAYDPELDRRVALKLLHLDLGSQAPERLLEEGRALARLSHPNVLWVHDVGTAFGQVYVALEYVEGESLAQWLTVKRPWREVLQVFLQAGAGLEAAHAAGIVHRDFKPANVLLGRDGRVRVADFGLAGTTTLASAGTRGGTLAYMSPEQHAGHAGDASADQFSFCVSLYAALYGTRPFAATDAKSLAEAVTTGALIEPRRGTGVPTWLWPIIKRGLHPKSAARHRSVRALLDALRARQANKRRWLVSTAALGVLLAAATPYFLAQRRIAECVAGATPIEETWNPGRRATIERAFRATQASFALDTWRRLEPRLDDFAASLSAHRRTVCTKGEDRHSAPDPLFAVRLACLDRARQQFDVLTGLLTLADRELVEKAVEAENALGHPERCAALRLNGAPLDVQTAARADSILADVSEAKIFEAAGRYEAGLRVARSASAAASALQVRHVEAAAHLAVARLEQRLGHIEAAAAEYQRALWAAEAAGDDEAAAEASTSLVTIFGYGQRRAEAARAMVRLTEAFLERLHHDPTLTAGLAHANSTVARAAGQYVVAEGFDRQACLLMERLSPGEPLRLAQALIDLSKDLQLQGKWSDALEPSHRAVELTQQALGPEHPELTRALSNEASLWLNLGRFEEALAVGRRVLALRQKLLSPKHPAFAHSQLEVGAAMVLTDQPEAGWSLMQEGLFTMRSAGFAPGLSYARVVCSQSARLANHLDDAVALGREALSNALQAFGPNHVNVGVAHNVLGAALVTQGQYSESIAHLESAISNIEASHGEDYADLAEPLRFLGRANLGLRRPKVAMGVLERSLRLSALGPTAPADVAETQLLLAQALWESGTNRSKARDLARQAMIPASPLRARHQQVIDDAARWLTSHPSN